MMVRELIEELRKFDMNAEVVGPGYYRVAGVPFGITEIVERPDAVLTDGSSYPVVMLRSE